MAVKLSVEVQTEKIFCILLLTRDENRYGDWRKLEFFIFRVFFLLKKWVGLATT